MKRRAALQLLAALAAGQAVPPGALEEILSGAAPDVDDRAGLDEWERTVHEYGLLVPVRPVGSLIGDLTADIIAVGRMLDRRNAPLVQAGLLRVSAGLACLLAAQFDDVGDRRAARVTWSTARRAADNSGDRDLQVWVRSKEASMARWSDRPATIAAALADDAITISADIPSKGLAQAYSVRSALAARQGDARSAQESLDSLADVVDAVDWPRYHAWAQAYAYGLLGDRRADAALQEARHDSRPEHAAELQMIQAVDLVCRREITEALDLATTVAESRPLSAARRHMTTEILTSLPAKSHTLPAAHHLRALTAAT